MSDTVPDLLPADVIKATAARRSRLAGLLSEHSVDALLVGYPRDIRHLTGFNGDDSLVLVGADTARIISDSRYDEYLNPWREVPGVEVVMGIRHRLEETVETIAEGHGIRRLGIQAERMTVAARGRLASRLGDRLVDTTGLVTRLRMRKDETEVSTIERAIGIQQDAFAAMLAGFRPGMTELQLGALLEFEMKTRGASNASFEPIIATGANSSVIHYTTGSTPIGDGVLLIDWGAETGGYCSDMTRTVGVGGPLAAPLDEVYRIVLDAQLAAIDACAPGKTCAEIDAVARTIIARAGYGEAFGHGLGHGLGLEVHESPYFNDLETETLLEPGMVMTVEPGIYLPGVGGVRIEDDVLITDGGHRVLSSWPKEPDSAVLEPTVPAEATGA